MHDSAMASHLVERWIKTMGYTVLVYLLALFQFSLGKDACFIDTSWTMAEQVRAS